MKRIPFVLQGDFTEFLKKELGYKKWEPPLFYAVKDPVMPLKIVPLAYSKVEIDCGWEARSQEGSYPFLARGGTWVRYHKI